MFEVRINRSRPDSKLYTIACNSDDDGFRVISVIIVGQEELALVDCQWTKANALRVLAEIVELDKPLKTIYVSHAHPDHYFGLETYVKQFPDVRVLVLPDVLKTLQNQFDGKLDEWKSEIGEINSPDTEYTKKIKIEPMSENFFEVEGEKIEVYGKVWGDLKYNTVVHIPSLSTLIGSDMLFNEAHPFTCEVTAEERGLWIKDLDRFEAFNCEVVIPGHAKFGLPYDANSFKFTRDYLIATEEELAKCKTRGEFYYNMSQRFPKAELLRSNEMNASVFLGDRVWDWREDD